VSREVVGVMMQDDAPPHWSVDFWVDDADATAAAAEQLGGAVVVPPYDSPGFREAVLADPQGAAFTVTQLVVPS
jgi:predicted enzyme related to lactoylglutathione lyase